MSPLVSRYGRALREHAAADIACGAARRATARWGLEQLACRSSCGSCQGDLSCATSADIPGGYCTKSCAASTECGSGNYCVQTSAGPACLLGCQADTDCRDAYSCQSAGQGVNVCYPAKSASSV